MTFLKITFALFLSVLYIISNSNRSIENFSFEKHIKLGTYKGYCDIREHRDNGDWYKINVTWVIDSDTRYTEELSGGISKINGRFLNKHLYYTNYSVTFDWRTMKSYNITASEWNNERSYKEFYTDVHNIKIPNKLTRNTNSGLDNYDLFTVYEEKFYYRVYEPIDKIYYYWKVHRCYLNFYGKNM